MALKASAKEVYTLPADCKFNTPNTLFNRVTNWAIAGLEGKTARLSAKDQRKLLGFVVGRGRIGLELRHGQWLAFNWVSTYNHDITYSGCFDLASGERVG